MCTSRASILLFCLGCFGFWVTSPGADSRPERLSRTGSGQTSTKRDRSAPKKVTFESTSKGQMEDEAGVHLGFTNFTASDGNTLSVLYKDFGSSANAQAFWEKQLAKAVRVIERKKKLDPTGTVVGERAEILLRLSPQRAIPAVLWTDGVKFHEIYSSSRDNILELEKVYRY
jgi:hypothetical protein